MTRRWWLQFSLNAVAAARAGQHVRPAPAAGIKLLDMSTLKKYVNRLAIPPVARPVGTRASRTASKSPADLYRVVMKQRTMQVHPAMPPTTVWSYGETSPGVTFDVRKGQPIFVEWVNELPRQHLFAIDHSLHGAGSDLPAVRTVVHVHGARVGAESDGYPENWQVPGQSEMHYYPNQQDAATLFYHDHAMGITRLNSAAGLVGMYLIRDEQEDSLPLPKGDYEIPLAIFDRTFREDGQIDYPVSGDPASPWVSQYYGAAILVNGQFAPFLQVEPRRYRFRVVNCSNSSFYRLTLSTEDSLQAAAQPFIQIGSDQGFLPESLPLTELITGPGERADVIVDFSPYRGQELYLRTEITSVLQFRVSDKAVDNSPAPPKSLVRFERADEDTAIATRILTLGDYQDRLGRSMKMLLNESHWSMPVTEKPQLHTTEIWSFLNLTDDTHPIHLHLVRFQILDRRPFDLPTYQLTRKIVYTDAAKLPDANELGWKDTVRADPGMVTRIIVSFDSFAGRYVWHCHVLEHEDNEMMRPYEIIAGKAPRQEHLDG